MDSEFLNFVILPIGLGLLGFIEPCSMGSNLLFLKFIEGRSRSSKILQTLTFMITRALFIGSMGAAAALFGSIFIEFQKGGWLLLGSAYIVLGAIFISGKSKALSHRIGLGMSRISGKSGSVALGVLFGLNIPACAAPLIFVLFGGIAVGSSGDIVIGFTSLALFGFALSFPIIIILMFGTARRSLDRFVGLSLRLPFWTGMVFVALGLWSAYFGIFVDLNDWV